MEIGKSCPVCKNTWTATKLIFSTAYHCKTCGDKAENIVAKHSKEDSAISNFTVPEGYEVRLPINPIFTSKTPTKDPNCPVYQSKDVKSTTEFNRSIREEVDAFYKKMLKDK